ncbi:MAG: phosphomannomutase/phosphoglucomutase [Firmicutes bacterium]|nr:phosphomannomutase/phosphoglucomutase [Bacillota bacterium]
MAINREIFREYDIRGLEETDLRPDVVALLGRVLADYFREAGKTRVLIGRDIRLSGERIRANLGSGLIAGGMEVVDIGVVISPMFYYARVLFDIDAGIMITASHNPGEYNGFKIALGPATIHGEEIQGVLRRMEAAEGTEIPLLSPEEVEAKVEKRSIWPQYLQMMRDKIKLGPKPLKVVVDCGNGTASLFAEELFTALGCEVIPLYCTSDPTFPNHHPDPVRSDNLKELQALVTKEGADVGIGFDGDGDRIGIVDNEGAIVWGDVLMVLYWREILPKYPGATAIIEVKCSQALVEEVEKLGGKPFFYRTGHSLIKAKMKEVGAVFTGEMSGHMFFADEYYGFDDAFYAAGRLLRILSNTDQSMSQLLQDVPKYPSTAESRVECSDRDKFRVVEELRDRMKAKYEVIDVDGARVLFPEGWGLVRASNTQPAIVARCEARTQEALEEITRIMHDELTSFDAVSDFQWEY